MSSLEHFERFFFLVAVGAGLVLLGCANLALGRRGGRLALRFVLSAAGCGAVAYALGALTRQELAVRAAGVLGTALAAVTLIGSDWAHRQAAAIGTVLRKPSARWGAVTVGGLAVVTGAAIWFDRADERLAEEETLELEGTLGRLPNRPTLRARAVTDRGTPVVLKEPQAVRAPGSLSSPEGKILRDIKLDGRVIRHSDPSDEYNCHGWVFTGGKFLLGPEDVELILKENGYTAVPEPHPGDVAVYRQSGTVAHTALVRYVAESQPVMVEGKWGVMGVFLHPADQSPYGTEYTFHRSTRRGHLLVGVGGVGPDPSVTAPPVTVAE